jgi:uncharacterized protein (TIGR03790 family)
MPLLLIGMFCAVWTALAAAELPDASSVVILANSAESDSMELARHYAERRGVPASRIVALPMSSNEEITWPEFVRTIWNPLLRAGIAASWIDAVTADKTDVLGRLKIASSGHHVEALVICRGVPLRIAHSDTLFGAIGNPLAQTPAFRTNEASVDSELALLAVAGAPIDAFVPNPLFEQDNPDFTLRRQIIPVGRLDGPSLADAKGLVDRALIAEREGLCGRAYVDSGGGPVNEGNLWLEASARELAGTGFEIDVDHAPDTLPATARFDAPVLYFGWYAWNANGPFVAPGFRFPAGAVALHIHSFSAATVRSADRGWAGPLVARGVTATAGNVGEPYLGQTHRPQLFARALARGEPLGRAALYAIQALSWKGVVIGDPLYRPFAVTPEMQWARRAELAPDAETYARIRRMRLLAAAGDQAGALALGQSGMRTAPGLPLALSLAGLQLDAHDNPAARRTLGVFALLRDWRKSDLPLVLAAAGQFAKADAPAEACRLIQRLLADSATPAAFREPALREGVEFARAAHDSTLVVRWQTELDAQSAPAKKAP